MRVALFSDHFYPELGGIQDSVECLARGLAARGHQIDLYVPQYSAMEYRRAQLNYGELDLGPNVSIHRLRSLPYRGPTLQTRLTLPSSTPISLMKHRRPDVIHSHTVFGLGLQALAASKFWDVPLVATHHMAMTVFATYISSNVLRNFARYVCWYLNQCDFVSAPAQLVFDEMTGLRSPHEIVSNSIDLDLFSQRPNAGGERGAGRPTIVYAGKFVKEKRVDLLVSALGRIRHRVQNATLVLAGHGDQEVALRGLADRLGVSQAVRFVGTLNKKDLARTYGASDIFVSMSDSEVQSISQMQAMASGLPVVCASSKGQELDLLHSPAEGVISVAPESVEEFAASVSGLLTDRSKMADLSRRATDAVRPYSIPAIAEQWEGKYGAVADLGSGS